MLQVPARFSISTGERSTEALRWYDKAHTTKHTATTFDNKNRTASTNGETKEG